MLKHFETKKVAKLILLALAIFAIPFLSWATDYTGTNFIVKDPVIDSGFQSSTSTNFGLGQSLAQNAIGESTSASFKLWSGFQYFFKVSANTLTATSGDASVSLSWTVPTVYLGIAVASYEVGVGTTSGSYTFTAVGSVTSYSASGLSNGTPYFFITKALDASGNLLVFSNEATATPAGVTPPSGGGGGGGYGSGAVVFNGVAYPNSIITLLSNSSVESTTTAGANGVFTFNVNKATGNYTFGLYATDANNNKSATLTTFQTVSSTMTTTINDLLIAPTLNLSHTAIKTNENLTATGYAAPNIIVTVFFSGPKNSNATATSNSSGFYLLKSPNGLTKGDYEVVSQYAYQSKNSAFSTKQFFKVGDSTIVQPPPGQCSRSDLNCDGKVELIDFSILLYFWEQPTPGKNLRVDIDGSGQVDLRDLSIMLYDWTG